MAGVRGVARKRERVGWQSAVRTHRQFWSGMVSESARADIQAKMHADMVVIAEAPSICYLRAFFLALQSNPALAHLPVALALGESLEVARHPWARGDPMRLAQWASSCSTSASCGRG